MGLLRQLYFHKSKYDKVRTKLAKDWTLIHFGLRPKTLEYNSSVQGKGTGGPVWKHGPNGKCKWIKERGENYNNK